MDAPAIRYRSVTLALAALAAAALFACDYGSDYKAPTPVATTGTVAATTTPPLPSPPAALARTPANNEFEISITREVRYIWPTAGAVTSYFGTGHPTGIDIALDLSSDSPIKATGAGIVSFAGGDTCCSLGNRVEITHPGGGRSVYGHLSRIDVSEGRPIEQGDVLGLGGATGDADGKHLHFELYQDEQLVDPLRYLPADQLATSDRERISCAEATIRLDPSSELDLRIFPRTLTGYEIQTVAYTGVSVAARNLGIVAEKQSVLTAGIRVPELAQANGETMEAGLDIVLAAAGQPTQQVTCRLILRTRITLPNPPGTGERHISGAEAPSGPTATPTRTPLSGNLAPAPAEPTPAAPVVRQPTPRRPAVQNPAPQKPPVQSP